MINQDLLLELMGGDQDMVDRFIGIFREQTPEQLQLANSQLKQEDWSGLSNTVHALKSQCRYLGLESIAGCAARIELLSDQRSNLESLPDLLQDLEEDLGNVLQSLG